jgi:hypothetical protein
MRYVEGLFALIGIWCTICAIADMVMEKTRAGPVLDSRANRFSELNDRN